MNFERSQYLFIVDPEVFGTCINTLIELVKFFDIFMIIPSQKTHASNLLDIAPHMVFSLTLLRNH